MTIVAQSYFPHPVLSFNKTRRLLQAKVLHRNTLVASYNGRRCSATNFPAFCRRRPTTRVTSARTRLTTCFRCTSTQTLSPRASGLTHGWRWWWMFPGGKPIDDTIWPQTSDPAAFTGHTARGNFKAKLSFKAAENSTSWKRGWGCKSSKFNHPKKFAFNLANCLLETPWYCGGVTIVIW